MKWIDVNDRLPEDKQKVKFKFNLPYDLEGFFEKYENGYQFMYQPKGGKRIYSIYGVTHWMPLTEEKEK